MTIHTGEQTPLKIRWYCNHNDPLTPSWLSDFKQWGATEYTLCFNKTACCGCPKNFSDTTLFNNERNETNSRPQLRVKHYFNEGFRKMHFYCTWVVPHHRLNFFCCGCPKSLPDTTILNNGRNGTNAWPQLRVKHVVIWVNPRGKFSKPVNPR